MKKYLLILLFSATISASGQTSIYHPFPTNTGNWFYQLVNEFGVPQPYCTQYILAGDTLISAINYNKVYTVPTYYMGAIREANKIIYFFPDTATHEYVLYDFNLSAGDTIFHPFGGTFWGNDTIIIWQVDSVSASDGYHRRLILNLGISWIEGIGSDCELFTPALCGPSTLNYILICFEGDSYVYPSFLSACVVSTPEQKESTNSISVYPNPSNGAFNVDIDQATKVKEISVSDLLGNIIFQRQATNESNIKIDNIKGGAYILTVLTIDNHIIKKIIISCP